jgi:hypothetical protein
MSFPKLIGYLAISRIPTFAADDTWTALITFGEAHWMPFAFLSLPNSHHYPFALLSWPMMR